MKSLFDTLKTEFEENSNANIAAQQKAYMRGQFEYYGLKTEVRRQLQKPFLVKEFLPKKKEIASIVKTLWGKPQREYHYFAQELAFKYSKQIEKNDIHLFEYMVTHKSRWDTVDFTNKIALSNLSNKEALRLIKAGKTNYE